MYTIRLRVTDVSSNPECLHAGATPLLVTYYKVTVLGVQVT